jgi:hypothetical protein
MVIDPLPADSLPSTSTRVPLEETEEDAARTEAASSLRTSTLAPDTLLGAAHVHDGSSAPSSEPVPTAQLPLLPERMSSISISASVDPSIAPTPGASTTRLIVYSN